MARKKRRRSDFKQIWLSDPINSKLDLGKIINYKFGVDCMKLLEGFSTPDIGINFTRGSKNNFYRHDRSTQF